MPSEIRPLTKPEIINLGDLFAEESDDVNTYLWQERRPDFLKIYNHFMSADPRFWGAFIDGKLVGTTGLIPMKVTTPYGVTEAWMDTDMFVIPAYRNKKIGFALSNERFKDKKANITKEDHLFFGVEQIPMQLDFCTKLGQPLQIDFLFPLSTTLRQEFLTEPQLPSITEGSLMECKSCLLAEMTDSQKMNWLVSIKTESFLAPALTTEIFSLLVKLDPQAQAIFTETNKTLKHGVVLISNSDARRFCITKKNSIVLERLRRKTQEALAIGDELKFGVLGLGFGINSLSMLAAKIRELADKRKLHCLSYRDSLIGSSSYFSSEFLDFKRRVFISFGRSHPAAKDIHSDINNNNLKIELDSIFL